MTKNPWKCSFSFVLLHTEKRYFLLDCNQERMQVLYWLEYKCIWVPCRSNIRDRCGKWKSKGFWAGLPFSEEDPHIFLVLQAVLLDPIRQQLHAPHTFSITIIIIIMHQHHISLVSNYLPLQVMTFPWVSAIFLIFIFFIRFVFYECSSIYIHNSDLYVSKYSEDIESHV